MKLQLAIALFAGLAAGVDAARAQSSYGVGDRVAAPIGNQFFDAVVTQVYPSPPGYRVHPLGFSDVADFTANPFMLKPWGSVQMAPWGGTADDPYLAAAKSLPSGSRLPVR